MSNLLIFGVAVLALIAIAVAALAWWRFVDRRAEARLIDALLLECASPDQTFSHRMLDGLPEPAQRFLRFAIVEGTPIHRAVDLSMSGDLSLGTPQDPRWMTMQARQVIGFPDGFIWQLSAEQGGLGIAGSDAAYRGSNWTRFWLAGLIPVARFGGGPDHARAAFGRYSAESVFWLPTAVLPGPGVRWEPLGPDSARVVIAAHGIEQAVDLTVDVDGAPTQVVFARWSDANPDKRYQIQPFGGFLSEHRTFQGITIPTRVEAGNFFGTEGYFPFFKARIGSAVFGPSGG